MTGVAVPVTGSLHVGVVLVESDAHRREREHHEQCRTPCRAIRFNGATRLLSSKSEPESSASFREASCSRGQPRRRPACRRPATGRRPSSVLMAPITQRFVNADHSSEEVDRMHGACVKSCLLQVTLWSYAYVKQGDF